jgi:hypothetical protein
MFKGKQLRAQHTGHPSRPEMTNTQAKHLSVQTPTSDDPKRQK